MGERDPGPRGQPGPRRLPGGGRGRRRRGRHRRDRRAQVDAGGPPGTRRAGISRRRAGDPHLCAQRGQCGEGRARADDRGDRRDRQPSAVAVGLRRGGAGDAHGFDGLQLQRRRPDRLAGSRGVAHRADQRARPVRPAAGRGPRLAARGRGHRPHRRRRGAVVRRATGGRPAAGCPDRSTPRGSAGPAGPAAPGPVHRPAGGQVRPPGPGLAWLGRAPPSRRGDTD